MECRVCPLPRSLATTYGISVDFSSSPYLDVSVRAVPPIQLWIHCTVTWYCHAGFPHSEIRGSRLICSSPRLIAACHVLLRLLMPRHSPCALSNLTFVTRRYRGDAATFPPTGYALWRKLRYVTTSLLFRFEPACAGLQIGKGIPATRDWFC